MASVIIISTFPDKKTITKIANQLVKRKIVACVNIIKISSIYSWKENIENQAEYMGPVSYTHLTLPTKRIV